VRVGDWEGDTIIGSHNGGAVIASMVERKSRYTFLSKAKSKTTTSVIGSINKKMLPVADLVFTVTLDKIYSNPNISLKQVKSSHRM
jgi:transposase, IS30 family